MATRRHKNTSQDRDQNKDQIQFIHNHCPQCGSKMRYEGGAQKRLKCSSCSYSRALNKNTDQVVNQPLNQGVRLNEFLRGLGQEFPVNAYSCPDCGAEIAMHTGTPLSICPFCTCEELEESDRDKKVIRPYSMIPFTVSQDFAIRALRKWLGISRWGTYFFPGTIFDLLEPPKMRGVYLPVFLFDALTRSTWSGELGIIIEQERKGKKVERMIWDPTAGYYEHFFENEELLVSQSVDDAVLEDILPYSYRYLVPYDPDYLKDNWTIELYQIPEMEGFKAANMIMDGEITGAVLEKLGEDGDDLRKLKIMSEKLSIAFKHVLVPVWMGTYIYEGEQFQFLINGQTGDISGDKPLDNFKMYIAVAIAVVLTILLVLLFSW